ncbi:MAG: bifunctional demethylmenaquinone methyltransferase/2-methoxy-6-polyprenyl-1,4-benzoquinol methylase UbiE [Bacteroidales bacterium]|nr:bifunctional demethylmenaquinone methyltransferase/2-methoxy-6-polyprenyl-1,4-benzoquinol methylase UbiE [Bacteroidales bacterium]
MVNETPETLLPYGEGDRKRNQVQNMFDAIANQYDFLNHFMSFRQDKGWRKKAILSLMEDAPKNMLDIATGTGDFALEAYKRLKPEHITGADLSEGMMEVGAQKVRKAGLEGKIHFEVQDCTALTFEDHLFDAVTVAFGVRNFENIAKGISEIYRVLKPGGKVVIIELSRPEKFPMKQLFNIYSSVVLPIAGRLFSKDNRAYEYLPASIQVVPQGKNMVKILENTGFKDSGHTLYTFGVCTMYSGRKPVDRE